MNELADFELKLGGTEEPTSAAPPASVSKVSSIRYMRLSRWAAGFGAMVVLGILSALLVARFDRGLPGNAIVDAPEVVFNSSSDREEPDIAGSPLRIDLGRQREPGAGRPTVLPPFAIEGEASLDGLRASAADIVPDQGHGPGRPSAELVLPIVKVKQAVGREDEPIPLDIDVSVGDPAARDNLLVVVAGLPDKARLSAGEADEAGNWHLRVEDLVGLRFFGPPDRSGELVLTVKSVVKRPDGTKAGVSQRLPIMIAGVVDTPSLRLSAEKGYEDLPVALDIKADLADRDGSEVLDIEISAIPEGAVLSAGEPLGAGPWRLSDGDLDLLKFIPPENWSGTAMLDVVFRVRERDGQEALFNRRLSVEVVGRADKPVLSVRDVTGQEGEPVPLFIEAATNDRDGSESLSLHVAGLPKSAFLSAGRQGPGGRWLLQPEDLEGIKLILPPFFTGPVNLEVVAIAREGLQSASVAERLTIDVVPSFNNALIAQMIEQGDELLRSKDLVTARLYYEEAARRGYAPAMTSMGLTYDPNEYKKLGLSAKAADEDLARHWYLRGIAAGDSKAADYLSALGRKPRTTK